MGDILQQIKKGRSEGRQQLAVLIDPDHAQAPELIEQIVTSVSPYTDYFFVGGSLLHKPAFETCIQMLKKICSIPIVIFPGSPLQISSSADAILFLSLISGRNPETLIGHHVVAAPYIKAVQLEAIPTGYMLVDCGNATTASYISNTTPLPYDKPEIAACTAMAGEMLGLQVLYLDGGSGAKRTVSTEMVQQIKAKTSLPLIVGGGIRSPKDARQLYQAGADLLVVGNACEKDHSLIKEIISLNDS